MKGFIEKSRYLSLIAVFSLLLASALAFGVGAVKTAKAVITIFEGDDLGSLILVAFIQIADVFLLATALFVFAVSLYELFIGPLDLPDWMVAHNLPELKAKLGSVLVLVMAATFVEHLVQWQQAADTLMFALAIAVVSAALIVLNNSSKKSGNDK